MLAASILNEKVLFVFGLVTLFLSGSIVLGINALTDSRRAQLASNIAQSMWGFAPASTQQTQLRRQRWAFRKLIAAGRVGVALCRAYCIYSLTLLLIIIGSMMSSLLLSTSVRALKPALAIGLSGGIWSMWCLGVTLFWYYSVEPTAAGADTEAETSAPDPSSRPQEDSRLPVTLITGFLGAGKTTLVKHILSNTAGMKVLVIENEVGEEGIDHDLLLNYAGKEDIVLLKNGCVCCTVRSDLIQTFRAIFQKNCKTFLLRQFCTSH